MSSDQNQHKYSKEASPCGECEVPHYNLFKCIECRITLCASCYLNPDKHVKGCKNARSKNAN